MYLEATNLRYLALPVEQFPIMNVGTDNDPVYIVLEKVFFFISTPKTLTFFYFSMKTYVMGTS